jgi:hypothetical protein
MAEYDESRMKYLAAEDTIIDLEGELAKKERQLIDEQLNNLRIWGSTLVRHTLTLKGTSLTFTELPKTESVRGNLLNK